MNSQKVNKAVPDRGRFFYGYIVVTAAFFILLVTLGMDHTFGIFFKPMLSDFGWTRTMTSGAPALAAFMGGVIGIVMGGLNDRFGPRLVCTLCGIFLGSGYLLMSLIGTIWQLYLVYGVIVTTGFSSWVPLLSTVSRWFFQRRSLMTGIVSAGIGVGTIIMPPVSSWLISAYGWRTSYMILGGIILVALVAVAQFLKRDPRDIGEVAYGDKKISEDRTKLLISGLSFKEAIYKREFWMAFTIFLCFGFCFYTTIIHIAPHATDLGISANVAAGILSVIGLTSIAGRIVLGGIADRIGNRLAMAIGFALMVFSFVYLLPAREVWMLYLFAVIFGFAYGGGVTQLSPLIAALFGLNSHGLIFGTTVFSMGVGCALGPFITGYIFDITGKYLMAFMICAAVGVAGLVLTIFLMPKRPEPA